MSLAVGDDPPNLEFELKLAASPQTLRRAFDELDLSATHGVVDATRPARQLTAIYFDTPDRRLQARNAALRVRREGERFRQTLKVDRGPLDRLEHEALVDDLTPRLERLPIAATRELGALFPEELAPVFTTDVVRRTRLVTVGDELGRPTRVELALDEGQVTAGDRSEAVSELELELVGGDRSGVFDVAKTLVDAGATRLVTRSKAARGYALSAGTPPAWARAAKVRLDHRQSVGEALGAVLDNIFEQIWTNHEAALDGTDPEGVHQLRVAVRRLRSALTLFGPVLEADRLAWLRDEARWLMGELGRPRDLDVFATEMLPPVASGRRNDGALGQLRAASEDARQGAYAALRRVMTGGRYTQFVLGFGEWVTGRGWHGEADATTQSKLGAPLAAHVGRVLDQRARAVRKRGRHFATLDTDARHEVRKSLKKLRYATDFFRELYPEKATRRYLKRLSTLQDAFGHMNDMAAAERLLGELVDPADPRLLEAKGLVVGWYAHAADEAEAELVDDWVAFTEARPFWKDAAAC